MIKYDPLKDRSEEMGWKTIQDEAVPSEAEQDVWARYTLWIWVVSCLGIMFWYME